MVIVIVFASIGQAFTTHLGNKLRTRITCSPARAIDATGGALVNVLAMLLVAWLIGSALAGTALPTIGREVRASKVLTGVSRMIPQRADAWFADFSSVLAQNGFPQVFTPFSSEPITTVPPPDPKLVSNGTASRARGQHRQGRRHGEQLQQGAGGLRLRLLTAPCDDQRARGRRRARPDGPDRRHGQAVFAPRWCSTTGSATSPCWTCRP